MFRLVKRNKRLWIDGPDGKVYTPPNFIRLQSREPMQELAAAFNVAGARDIRAIIEFESNRTA